MEWEDEKCFFITIIQFYPVFYFLYSSRGVAKRRAQKASVFPPTRLLASTREEEKKGGERIFHHHILRYHDNIFLLALPNRLCLLEQESTPKVKFIFFSAAFFLYQRMRSEKCIYPSRLDSCGGEEDGADERRTFHPRFSAAKNTKKNIQS